MSRRLRRQTNNGLHEACSLVQRLQAEQMRVHELAKELQIETKDMMPLLKELGIEVKTHSSGLLDYQVDDVRRRVRAGKAGKDAGSAKGLEPVKEVEKIDVASGEKLMERRIGQTVIRRRKKAEAEPEAAVAQTEDPLAAAGAHEPDDQLHQPGLLRQVLPEPEQA